MKLSLLPFAIVVVFTAGCLIGAEPEPLSAPPQDRGLPYTRSARQFGLSRIKNAVAVFAGSRFAYVKGYKVRLDDSDFRLEAVLRDGEVLVPKAFAGVLQLKKIEVAPAPAYLADRWVYTLPIPAAPETGPTIDVNGKPYLSLVKLAKSKGLKVAQPARGLLLIGDKEASFAASEATLLQTVITLFDSPEKFADPEIATRSIPILKRQGPWTDHVKATLEQLQTLAGPETQWPTTPKSAYDLKGFNSALLGSKVPEPGVYPRLLFSPEDVPVLAKRFLFQRLGQMSLVEMETLFRKSWWDPATSDGQIFQKLAKGEIAGLEFEPGDPARPWDPGKVFKGQKPGIYNSHIYYVPQCLTSMALYCLLTGNEERGKQVANAITNYYTLREPFIDMQRELSDSEFGSSKDTAGDAETSWRRSFHPGQHMDLAFALDFAGKWMSAPQKETMRRIIAKLTYGRRSFGQDGPVRLRDINWMTWDLTQFLAVAAIEGLEGFDREVYETGLESARAFCEWGIDEHGQIFESNGKNGGGLQFQILSMITLARRGENLWGHPHFRKLLAAQVQCTSPNGQVTLSGGTFSGSPLSLQAINEIKAFYPENRCADYLLSLAIPGRSADRAMDETARRWLLPFFRAATYPDIVSKLPKLRLPGPTYPAFTRSVVYDTDWSPVERDALKLPLDFSDPVHGVFSVYSDTTPEATWMAMLVRPNHYMGSGHHHSDAGMFHFSALGVNWFAESPFIKSYEGKYHNQVLVDGESMPGQFPARAAWLGAKTGEQGSMASADLTYAYSWRWNTQPEMVWNTERARADWELEPAQDIIRYFAGTGRYKMRPWWPTYNYSNFMPTARAPFNPMRHVFRTVAMVRGARPYGIVVDDLKKDDADHHYQWTAMLAPGVWRADLAGLEANQIALAWQRASAVETSAGASEKPLLFPSQWEPVLLVTVLSPTGSGDADSPLIRTETVPAPSDAPSGVKSYDRLVVNLRGKDAAFRILLTPFRGGEIRPSVKGTAGEATVAYDGPADTVRFLSKGDPRTRIEVSREGNVILAQ